MQALSYCSQIFHVEKTLEHYEHVKLAMVGNGGTLLLEVSNQNFDAAPCGGIVSSYEQALHHRKALLNNVYSELCLN